MDTKDNLIVAAFFFLVSNDWFDNWIRDIFPSLRDTNKIVITLIKTVIFAAIYWMYHAFYLDKKNSNSLVQ